MRRTPRPSKRAAKPKSASVLLKALKGEVLKVWEERARREIPAARRESHPILIDTLPLLLDQLVEALSPRKSRNNALEGSTACQEHGGERARMTSYTLENIIDEYRILRGVLFEVLEAAAPISAKEKALIWTSIEEVMKQSALAFGFVQETIREQFFMTLTHDLRGPLSAAKTNAQLILRYIDKPDQHARLAAKIVENIGRVDKMITDLLDANRVRAGERLSLDLKECDLSLLIGEVIEELSIVHGKQMKTKLPKQAIGFWDTEALRRVVENLTTNAIKYGDKDAPVTIILKAEHGRTILSVHNRGNPIPAEEQETLFKAYQRTRAAQSGNAKGWGLGLALVRGVAEAHGGSVIVDSAPQRGTTFSIDIPSDARPFQARSLTPLS